MSRATHKQRESFAVAMAKELPDLSIEQVARLASLLMRQGSTYCRLQEETCGVEMTERQEKRHDRKEANVERRVTELCAPHNIRPVFEGDPRGHTIKLVMPSGRTDDWGHTGICVPTS